MFNRGTLTIGILVLLSLAFGCAPVKQSIRLFESPEERLLTEYLEKAHDYEQRNDMAAALEQYELAIAIDPSHEEALQGRHRAQEALHVAARAHYEKGLEYRKQGKYALARHEFLIALRLRPDYKEAAEMLTSRNRPKSRRFIVHEIKAGESLSKMAKWYYGDYKKFPIIAEFNNLSDATEVEIGQTVKIPEIEGLEFLRGKEDLITEEQYNKDLGHSNRKPSPSRPQKQKPSTDKSPAKKAKSAAQVAQYRDRGAELFQSRKYPEAIAQFQKVLSVHPKDKEALEYCYRSHFELAQTLFEERDYLQAREQFEATLRYNGNCRECHDYIEKSENLYKDYHYKKGMRHYGNEQLVEAIEEWERVIEVDPEYKKVDYLVIKAQTILKKLEEIKAAEQEQAAPNY